MKKILDFWPMPKFKPRKSQEEALKWIEGLPPEKKYILCEIPVGGGKSPLALNFSAWIAQSLGDSFILTTQKILQKQYEDSFDKHLLKSVYGKSNYNCESKQTNCDIGNDLKPSCDNCPSRSALVQGNKSPNMILNYTLALLYFKYLGEDSLRPRDVMVFDECHTLEHHLTEFQAVTVSERRCIKLQIKFKHCKDIYSALDWINDTVFPAVEVLCKRLSDEVRNISDKYEINNVPLSLNDKHLIKENKSWDDFRGNMLMLLGINKKEVSEQYVLVNDSKSLKFKELYGSRTFQNLIEPMANKFLFMSSTILDKDEFCRDLGINIEEAAFISLPSEFPEENRPVIYSPVVKMNYGWDGKARHKDRLDMVEKIMLCCEQHPEDNGIIHTGSFKIAEWLTESLDGLIPHRILHHNPGNDLKRDDVIGEFMESDTTPKILISPSITEGLDLKDDKGRFAIFAKVPYPFLGDQWIKKRMNISNSWYQRQAFISIIQGGGRIVRTEEDWGYVYILDESFGYLKYQMNNKIPPWWSDAFIQM